MAACNLFWYELVLHAAIAMSQVTHSLNESCQKELHAATATNMSEVTRSLNESCQKKLHAAFATNMSDCKRPSQSIFTCKTYEWVMPNIWMSVSPSLIWTRIRECATFIRAMATCNPFWHDSFTHMNNSFTYEWLIHIWMTTNDSFTYEWLI